MLVYYRNLLEQAGVPVPNAEDGPVPTENFI